jgi:hypothetical protein
MLGEPPPPLDAPPELEEDELELLELDEDELEELLDELLDELELLLEEEDVETVSPTELLVTAPPGLVTVTA